MYKNRTIFGVAGEHPLLLLVRDMCIQQGMALVDINHYDGDVDFVLLGCTNLPNTLPSCRKILLSVDDVYTTDKMVEDEPTSIHPLHPQAKRILEILSAETNILAEPQNMVIRVFGIYGPGTPQTNVVSQLVTYVDSDTDLAVYYPGYQTRTFLHRDDFLMYMKLLIEKFLEGSSGIYNVGSEEKISIKRLADTCYQLKNGIGFETPIVTLPTPAGYRWSVIPDMTRTKALTKYIPNRSLRIGIWELIKKRETHD